METRFLGECPSLQRLLDLAAAGEPPYAVAPNRTETSFDTPGSCMVTP